MVPVLLVLAVISTSVLFGFESYHHVRVEFREG
jgi:hypothetical protein